MGLITKPFTFSSGQTIASAQTNSDHDTIYSEFNGNIDNANVKAGANIDAAKLLNASITNAKLASSSITDAKLDYTSLKLLRVVGISGNGRKIAYGKKAFTMAGGTVSVTITFSTDSTDGNPAFTSTPHMTFGFETGGAGGFTHKITSISSTSCVVTLDSSSAGAQTGNLHWMAIGNA